MLLTAQDPAPVRVLRETAMSDFFLTADHAGHAIPIALGDLGVSAAERERELKRIADANSRVKPVVTRFKGLGEMSAIQLRETTMAPQTRRLVQLTIDAKDNPDQLLDMLLAKKRAGDRREWLESKGNLARL